MSLLQILLVILVSFVSTGLVMAYCLRDRGRTKDGQALSAGSPISFLFEEDDVIHATPLGRSLLRTDVEGAQWSDVRKIFATRFPALPQRPPVLGSEAVDLDSVDPEDQALLRIEPVGRHTRFELVEPEDDPAHKNSHMLRSLQVLHQRIDEVCQTAPYPMWRVSHQGDVVWSNAAYDELAREAGDEGAPILSIPSGPSKRRNRLSVEFQRSSNKVAWYDVTAAPVDGGLVCHANNIDAVIQAEIAQRNFVQTLAKTFAQLSTGLAIFDRNRQLVLFNPALIDLTGLQAEFLSARPEMMTFFDNLRDRRIMPEPKNYATWRQEISTMIDAAADGSYEETWSLENGRTYRVTGRPHPDGAIAFLVEDISAEMSLTRNIRSELDQNHALLDTLDDAIAVFSASGFLTYCNAAYRELLLLDPDKSFAHMTVVDCTRVWQEILQPDPAWGEVRDYTMKVADRVPWETKVTHKDGYAMKLSVAPLATGATVVRLAALPLQVELQN